MMDDSDAYDYGDPKAPGYADSMFDRADAYRDARSTGEQCEGAYPMPLDWADTCDSCGKPVRECMGPDTVAMVEKRGKS